ncbi:MAG TPA: hydrogenase maturation nickel metallochaperone HypA [Isosphaeraceae bacterium]|jgi:hydrogenase nickel incorporation protein HypA/HybF
MHEVGLMQAALEIALRHAERHGAGRVHGLALRVGPLSGAVPEALEFAFDVVAQGTIAEGARLEIRRVPILCACAACGLEFRPTDFPPDCPGCGRPGARVTHGRELELDSVEIS